MVTSRALRHRWIALAAIALAWSVAPADAAPLVWGWGAEGDMPAPVRQLVVQNAAAVVGDSAAIDVQSLPDAANINAFRHALRYAKLARGVWFGYAANDRGGRLIAWLVDAEAGDIRHRSGNLGTDDDRPVNLAARLAWELRDEPLAPAAVTELAAAYEAWRAGDIDGANTRFRRALIVSPHAPSVSRDAGRMWQEAGRPDAALVWYEDALRRDPNDFLTLRWLALLHQEAGEIEPARQALERALEVGPRLPSLLVSLAYLYRENDRAPQAQVLLTEALQRDPDDTATIMRLVDAAEVNHDWRAAAWGLGRLLEMNAVEPKFCRLQFSYQLNAGDLVGAAETLARLRAAEPDDEELERDQTRLLLASGQYEEAVPRLEAAVAAEPGAAWAWNGLGQAYYRLRRFPDAARAWERAFALQPGDETAERLLYKCYELSGDKARVLPFYEKRLRDRYTFRTEDLQRYLDLAAELGQPERARNLLQDLAARGGDRKQRLAAAIALARLQERDGDTGGALETYNRIAADGETPPRLLFELGRLELLRGSTEAATGHFRSMLVDGRDGVALAAAARLADRQGLAELATDLYGGAFRADASQTVAGLLFLERVLLADQDRDNQTLLVDLDAAVTQPDERELLYWLQLYWAARTGHDDYYAALLPHVLRFIDGRAETKVELSQWPAAIDAHLPEARRAELLDLLAVFTRQTTARDFAARHGVGVPGW